MVPCSWEDLCTVTFMVFSPEFPAVLSNDNNAVELFWAVQLDKVVKVKVRVCSAEAKYVWLVDQLCSVIPLPRSRVSSSLHDMLRNNKMVRRPTNLTYCIFWLKLKVFFYIANSKVMFYCLECMCYINKYSTSLNIYPLFFCASSSRISFPSGSTQIILAKNSPSASLYRCIPSFLKRAF